MMRRITTLLLALIVLAPSRADLLESSSMTGRPFFRNFSAEEYGGHSRNFDIECDSTGVVYIANFEGLITWDGVRWTMMHTPGISRITSLYKADDGNIWFGGFNVLGYLDNDKQPHYIASDTDTLSTFGEVTRIKWTEDHISFVAEGSTYRVSGGIVESGGRTDEGGPSSTSWNGIFINEMLLIQDLGIRALASESNGLIMIDGNGSVIFSLDTDDGLCSNSITALKYDGKGSLWGVTDNGLFRVSISSVYSQYGESDGLFGRVNAILDTGSSLFVGTLQGLFRQLPNGKFSRIEEIGLSCWSLTQDKAGHVLAATANGVFQCTPEISQITERHTLCICPEPDGSFLTGEIDGIYKHDTDGKEWCLIPIPNVCKMQRDEDGGVLAINYYHDVYYKEAGSDSFVPSDREMSLLLDYTDASGHKWTSNEDGNGLFRAGLTANEQEWCRLLNDYEVDAMYVRGNGAWIGGSFGLYRINLELMKTLKAFKPKAYIRSFETDGPDVSYSVSMDKADPLGSPKYSYRLRNNDRWSRWTGNSEQEFNNLSAGKYQLTVRCMDSYGNISEADTVPFRIHAPIYLRWYAFLLYTLIIYGVLYAAMRYRLYRAAKEKERLERIVDERTRELKEAQNKLLTQERQATVGKLTKGLIDRILNPMNYINNFTLLTKGLVKDVLQDIDDDKDKMSPDIYDDLVDVSDMMTQNLGKIEQHGMATTRILKAMEELLKEHSGKLEPTEMEPICKQCIDVICKYCKDKIGKYGISVTFDNRKPGIKANIDAANMEKAIASMLSNSIYAISKKMEKGVAADFRPEVKLTLDKPESGKGCLISIYDNGIGIEESILDKIYDPFFTTKPTSEAPGVGLYLGQQIVQYAGGTISAMSVKDEYTEFRITLP